MQARHAHSPQSCLSSGTEGELAAFLASTLADFEQNLTRFSDSTFGCTTERALRAAEPLYAELVIDSILEYVGGPGSEISQSVRQILLHDFVHELLLQEHIGALSAIATDCRLQFSQSTLDALRPLSSFVVESVLKQESILFLGAVAERFCPEFLQSEKYAALLERRIQGAATQASLQEVCDILDALPVPPHVIARTHPTICDAILRETAFCFLPECITRLQKSYALADFLSSPRYRDALEQSCCEALQRGDRRYVFSTLHTLTDAGLLTFDQIVTPRVQSAIREALRAGREELSYFANCSKTPESGPESCGPLRFELDVLDRLLRVRSPFQAAVSKGYVENIVHIPARPGTE